MLKTDLSTLDIYESSEQSIKEAIQNYKQEYSEDDIRDQLHQSYCFYRAENSESYRGCLSMK